MIFDPTNGVLLSIFQFSDIRKLEKFSNNSQKCQIHSRKRRISRPFFDEEWQNLLEKKLCSPRFPLLLLYHILHTGNMLDSRNNTVNEWGRHIPQGSSWHTYQSGLVIWIFYNLRFWFLVKNWYSKNLQILPFCLEPSVFMKIIRKEPAVF